MEGEKLPSTRATFIPHLKQVIYTSMRDKPYQCAHPLLPAINESGWVIQEGAYIPEVCILPHTPQ